MIRVALKAFVNRVAFAIRRWPSAVAAVVVMVAAVGVFAQSIGGGQLSNGAVGGLPRSVGGGRPPAAGDPCKEADAFLNYDARLVAGTDGVAETTWANAGTGSTTWDADTASGGGLTYQQAGDCQSSPHPCLVTDAAGLGRIYMGAAVTKTWTHQLQCWVGASPDTATNVRAAQVSTDIGSRNAFSSLGLTSMVYIADGAGNQIVDGAFDRTTDLIVFCIDITTPASSVASLNGSAENTADVSGKLFRDIERVVLGGRLDLVNPWDNLEMHQFIAWDADPGLTVQQMSQCLHDAWSS